MKKRHTFQNFFTFASTFDRSVWALVLHYLISQPVLSSVNYAQVLDHELRLWQFFQYKDIALMSKYFDTMLQFCLINSF